MNLAQILAKWCVYCTYFLSESYQNAHNWGFTNKNAFSKVGLMGLDKKKAYLPKNFTHFFTKLIKFACLYQDLGSNFEYNKSHFFVLFQ